MSPNKSIGVSAADTPYAEPAYGTDPSIGRLWTLDAIAVTGSAMAVVLSCWIAMLLYLT
jgi:hypothetical protein